jgi:hypothetical protein
MISLTERSAAVFPSVNGSNTPRPIAVLRTKIIKSAYILRLAGARCENIELTFWTTPNIGPLSPMAVADVSAVDSDSSTDTYLQEPHPNHPQHQPLDRPQLRSSAQLLPAFAPVVAAHRVG